MNGEKRHCKLKLRDIRPSSSSSRKALQTSQQAFTCLKLTVETLQQGYSVSIRLRWLGGLTVRMKFFHSII